MITIDFLYYPSCRGSDLAWKRLHEILQELQISPPPHIRKIEVTTTDEIILYRFRGSPTIRVNGQDVDPSGESSVYSIACRSYGEGGLQESSPPKDMIRDRILSALETELKTLGKN